jgi:hypothetical protein
LSTIMMDFPRTLPPQMVQLGGLEPPTSGSTDRRSNQLSYSCTSAAGEAGPARGCFLANAPALQARTVRSLPYSKKQRP